MEKRNVLEKNVRVMLRDHCQEQGRNDITPLSQFVQGVTLVCQGALVAASGLELIDQVISKCALHSNS